jgi:uncharacterized repeat protein (TIGR04138 family)
MNIRDQLARVIGRDSRYTIEAYAFVLESLRLARQRKLKEQARQQARTKAARGRRKAASPSKPTDPGIDPGHVTGPELCHAARRLAVRSYGLMAVSVLARWGLHSTSDIGEIVYNLIVSGDLEKTPNDSRADFDNVFDFAKALRPKSLIESEKTL